MACTVSCVLIAFNDNISMHHAWQDKPLPKDAPVNWLCFKTLRPKNAHKVTLIHVIDGQPEKPFKMWLLK